MPSPAVDLSTVDPPAVVVSVPTEWAIGGYVGAARNVTTNPSVTVDEAIASLLSEIAMQAPTAATAYTSAFAGYAAVSAFYGVAVHAYEVRRACARSLGAPPGPPRLSPLTSPALPCNMPPLVRAPVPLGPKIRFGCAWTLPACCSVRDERPA